MGSRKGTKRDKYIHGVHEGGCSQGRLALSFRVQRLLNAFEAGVAVAAVNGGPSIEFYMSQTRVKNLSPL